MLKTFTLFIISLLICVTADAQWIKQTVNTTASLRGLSVVNTKIVWASGTGGTFLRTVDGGTTWKVGSVAGAEKLDFRDVEAFDAKTAFVLSIGNGEDSRIYKTVDGGETWKLQFKNTNAKAFFDAIACWDKKNCIAMSDPVGNKFVLINTTDGGATWKPMDTKDMPATKNGEAAFAASGTCLITQGKNNAFIVSGGNDARVFRSNNRGKSWLVADTPIVKGTAGSGIFSIAMRDKNNGVIVGGNYEKPKEATGTFAATADGGKTWQLKEGLGGYRSGVTYTDRNTLIAVGTSGFDIPGPMAFSGTVASGVAPDFNSVQANGKYSVWAVGPAGGVFRYIGPIGLI
jgi:photosystem II stability/assembly factor-like uncharacterized protein